MRHGRTVTRAVSPSIEFGLLGPLEARVEGRPVVLGGPKQRALLALLVLHANDVVALDRLIEELWEEAPPPSAPAYVQNCVSRLRKELGPKTVETTPPGYRLRAATEAVDATRFERLVRDARSLPTRDRVDVLREAQALWRGEPLSDLAYWSFAAGADPQPRRATGQRARATARGGARARSPPRVDRRARGPRARAPDARTASLAADARAPPLRPTARRTCRVPGGASRDRRGIGHRAR